jgi:hypothetical protein
MRYSLILVFLAYTSAIHAQFTEVQHGFLLNGLPSGTTSGVSWYDFDYDGWDDLTIGQGNAEILVFRNVQGSLQLFYAFPNTTQVKSFQWVDYDNDGDADFFVCAVNASCTLWRNEGGMNFTNVSANLNLPSLGEDSMGASWGDYDRDGLLDVYVCNYFGQNWLLHNNGDGTFEDVAPALGVSNSNPNRPTYMCSWVDYNNDCLLDLFVGNDLNQPSEMYENTGDGFVAVGQAVGLALTMEAMGIAWSDYDNDLDLDVYITNVASGNKLMRNDNGVFTDAAAGAGAAVNALSWGCMWMDFNNDGLDDLHVGTQAPLVAQNINFLLQHMPDTTFSNVSMPADAGNCFASAKGDLNNDGFWDFCDSFVLPASFKVWQNNGVGGNWVKLALQGTGSNREAIGTKIYYWVGGTRRYVHTFCGESFFGQDSQYEILSVGSATAVDSLQIEWPGGSVDMYYNLEVNRVHAFSEGAGSGVSIVASKAFLCTAADELILTAPEATAYEWSTGASEQSIVVNEPGAYFVRITARCNVEDSVSIAINLLPPPVMEEITQHPSCFGADDGCMSVLINGEEPVALVWQNISPNIAPCTYLAGVYTYEAIDAFQCVHTGTIELIDPLPLSLTAESFSICAGTVAPADLLGAGGTGAFSYAVVGGANVEALSPGDYTGIVTDENGCQAQDGFTIGAYPAVNFVANADSVCFGNTAVLQYFGSGGALPYLYDWQGENPNILPAGFYEFTLTDANGCTDMVSVQVAEYPFLDAQISAFSNANNGANGSMELTVSGGLPPYDILWSNGETGDVLDGIGQGTYSVTVTDNNECVSTDSQSIIDLDVVEWEAKWSVYPNPAGDFLNLVGLASGTYTLCDIDGRLLLAGSLTAGKNAIDFSKYPAGTYVLTVEEEGRVITKRVTKL